jgi:hypothetical protein
MSPRLEALIFAVEHRQAERDRSVKILFEQTKNNCCRGPNENVWKEPILNFKDQHRHESENAPPWRSEILPQVQRLIAGGKGRSSLSR